MSLRGWRFSLALLLGLVGCVPLVPKGTAPVDRRLESRFELVGRLAVASGDRSASMGLEWRHDGHGPSDEWLFLSPLGQIVARIEADQAGAVLYAGGSAPVRAPTAQDLMERILGLAPPLDGMAAWVQAVPRAGARVRALDEIGRPASVADEGWVIDYLEYSSPLPDARPRRMAANWGEATLKLVVDQWTALP